MRTQLYIISCLLPFFSTESTLKRFRHKQPKGKICLSIKPLTETTTEKDESPAAGSPVISLDVWLPPHRKDPSSEQLNQGTGSNGCKRHLLWLNDFTEKWLFTAIVLPGISVHHEVKDQSGCGARALRTLERCVSFCISSLGNTDCLNEVFLEVTFI